MKQIMMTVGLLVVLGLHAAAYTLSGYAWGTSSVGYYINPSNPYTTASAAIAAVQAGAAAWNNQAGISSKLVYKGVTNKTGQVQDGQNIVSFGPLSAGIAYTALWAGSGNQLSEFDMVLNTAYPFFAVMGCAGGYYIETITTHEFGHALGLFHSEDAAAVMYATTPVCDTSKQNLQTDDLVAIHAAYADVVQRSKGKHRVR